MTLANSHEPKPSARCAQIACGFLVCAFPAVVFLIVLTAADGQRADGGSDGRDRPSRDYRNGESSLRVCERYDDQHLQRISGVADLAPRYTDWGLSLGAWH